MSIREIIGKLTLQEKIHPIDRNKLPNTFVVHIPNPLASYYNQYASIDKPNSIVFVTKTPASFEKILRATKKINEQHGLNLDGAKCEMTLGMKKHSGIRLFGIDEYSSIQKIQEIYAKEGFQFARNERLKSDVDALIRVNKFFTLDKVEDGIYQSPNNKNRYYIVIPKDLDWDTFRDVTFDIKNNVSVSGYDVAKGIFYENDGITEMVRIIRPKITLDMVKEVKKKYEDRLS